MFDLKLPGIEPAGRVPSAADAIDRAGSAFGAAASAAGDVLLAPQMAQIATQTQEATLQVTRGLNDALHLIRTTPYLKPERVQALFGGKPPPGIRLTKKVMTPTGEVEQTREYVPMHEVAPFLFDERAASSVENATRGIEGAGWQDKFRLAAAADVERARAEALDWQRAQQLADAEIQSVDQYNQAMASRSFGVADAILKNADMTMDVKTREALRADHPRRVTEAKILDRLRLGTIEDLGKLEADIAANNTFEAPLSSDDQFKLTAMARQRRAALINEQEEAAKRAKEAAFQAVANVAEEALKKSVATGEPASKFFSVADIPDQLTRGMDFSDFMVLKNALDADPKKPADPATEARLFQHDHDGTLRAIPVATMWAARAALGDRWGWWMERWASAKDPNAGGAGKKLFSEDEEAAVNRVLEGYYKIDPKKEPVLFDTAKAHLQRNLLAWRAKNPGAPMDYLAVRTEAARTTFNSNLDFGRALLTNDPDTQREWVKKYLSDGGGAEAWGTLVIGIGAAQPGRPISELDVKTHLEQMAEEQPAVTEAWAKLNPAAALDGAARAAVHSILINPVELARIDARLEGREPNQRNRIHRIVQDMQVTQSVPAAAENEARARQEAEQRQVTAAGAELKQKHEAETAAQKAARVATEKAERDRFRALPEWQQRAEVLETEEVGRRLTDVERQIRGRIEAEDREAQWAESRRKGRNYILGQRFADDPVAVEMEKRVKAEVSAQRISLENDVRAWFIEARATYRALLADFQAGDPETVKLFNRHTLDSFDNYVKARREGKVR